MQLFCGRGIVLDVLMLRGCRAGGRQRPQARESPSSQVRLKAFKPFVLRSIGGNDYSYRRLSTGSNWAARAAGTVPKITPTSDDTKIAITADQALTGTRYSVRKRTE